MKFLFGLKFEKDQRLTCFSLSDFSYGLLTCTDNENQHASTSEHQQKHYDRKIDNTRGRFEHSTTFAYL